MKNSNHFIQIGLIAGLVLIIAIVVLALLGPAQGNIYSNLVNSLDTRAYSQMGMNAPASGESFETASAVGAFIGNDIALEPELQETNNQERVILKNATISITVEDPEARINELAAMAESMGGWIVTSNVYATTRADGDETTNGSITIRIPAERLDEVLERIKSDTISVNNENITGQDVTNEYVDLSSRLKNLEVTEIQLQRIMETATAVEDVLAVQRELTTVRENIEVIQGRLNYFNEAAAYASVRIDVQPKPLGPVQTQQVGWNPGTTAERALGSLVRILQGLADLSIAVVIVILPLAIIIGIPGWLIWRSRRRFGIFRRSNPSTANTQKEA